MCTKLMCPCSFQKYYGSPLTDVSKWICLLGFGRISKGMSIKDSDPDPDSDPEGKGRVKEGF